MFEDELKEKCAVIVGCGGLGGFVIDEISRAGIGKIVLIDGDKFDESNMNRQLLANYETIGKKKAKVYAEWLKNQSKVKVVCIDEFLSMGNANALDEADIVLDCVDSISTKLFLSSECKKRNKVLIHAAVDGEEGQVMVCFPDENNFERLYANAVEPQHVTVSYAVATIASIQTSFAIKTLIGKADKLRNKMVVIDLESFVARILEI